MEEAIKRDKLRDEPVGEDVIRKMIKIQGNWWYPLNPDFSWVKEETDLPTAYIVDIDWTLAFMDEKRTLMNLIRLIEIDVIFF